MIVIGFSAKKGEERKNEMKWKEHKHKNEDKVDVI